MTHPITALNALMAAREARNTGSQRPAIIETERNPRAAIAYAMSVVNGESSPDRAEALEALAARISVLKHGDSNEALEELAAHLPLLECQWLSLTIQASTTKNPDVRVKLTKLALQCQSAFSRTLALIATLKAQRDHKTRVLIHEDEGEDEGS
ncbi:MAG: hypothetical protein IV105_17650 [Rhizobacter sp.]|nr:hypothetical protein [Rhizobacter sp.]